MKRVIKDENFIVSSKIGPPQNKLVYFYASAFLRQLTTSCRGNHSLRICKDAFFYFLSTFYMTDSIFLNNMVICLLIFIMSFKIYISLNTVRNTFSRKYFVGWLPFGEKFSFQCLPINNALSLGYDRFAAENNVERIEKNKSTKKIRNSWKPNKKVWKLFKSPRRVRPTNSWDQRDPVHVQYILF